MLTVGLFTIETPVPAAVIPQEPEYHFHIPRVPSAPPPKVIVVDPPEQRPTGDAKTEVGVTEVSLRDTYLEETLPVPQEFEG